jgi:LysM repeat protein
MRTRLTLTFVLSLLAVLLLTAAASADSGSTHVVRAGETLGTIAAQHGVSASTLAAANGIKNPNLIKIGQVLVIPGGSAAKSTGSSSASTAKASSGTYVVRKGDTLGSIAARFGVSASALASLNGIANPDRITVGKVLRIPGKSSGSASAGPSSTGKVGGTRFVADLSAQHCWLYRGGVVVGSWRCSSGRAGARTAPGTYKIQSKIRNAYASTWDFWMPYWLGIYWAGSTENGIHGLPYNPKTGRTTWAGMVGTPITFGCIMLDNANAKKLWETAYIGMPVVITR